MGVIRYQVRRIPCAAWGFTQFGDQGGQDVSESVASSVEQRAYPRIEVVVSVELDVELAGVTTRGNVVNLSRSGLLARVQHRVSVGQHCVIRFPISEHDEVRAGTVVRSQADESSYLLALQFDSPLLEPAGSKPLSLGERDFLSAVRDHNDGGAPLQVHAVDNAEPNPPALRTLRALDYIDLRHNGYWITAAGRAALK